MRCLWCRALLPTGEHAPSATVRCVICDALYSEQALSAANWQAILERDGYMVARHGNDLLVTEMEQIHTEQTA